MRVLESGFTGLWDLRDKWVLSLKPLANPEVNV